MTREIMAGLSCRDRSSGVGTQDKAAPAFDDDQRTVGVDPGQLLMLAGGPANRNRVECPRGAQADDELVPTALVGDPLGFLRVTRAEGST